VGGVDELEDVWGVVKLEIQRFRALTRPRRQGAIWTASRARRRGGIDFAAEADGSFFRGVALDELADWSMTVGCSGSTGAGLAPGEKAVAAQDDAVAAGFRRLRAHRQAHSKPGRCQEARRGSG